MTPPSPLSPLGARSNAAVSSVARPPAVQTAAALSPASLGRRVTGLLLHEFRSWHRLSLGRELLAGANAVVLIGENGGGKTNLLEAVSMLSPGRGLRRAPLSHLAHCPHKGGEEEARQGHGGWSIQAAVLDEISEMRITTTLPPSRGEGESRGRSTRVNDGPPESLAQLAGIAPMLWLTPSLERGIAESATARRRFLDRIVMSLEPEHGRRCAAYERAMRERNRLLQDGGSAVWMEGVEEVMAREGASLQAARRRVVGRLGEALEKNHVPEYPKGRIFLRQAEGERLRQTEGEGLRQAEGEGLRQAEGEGLRQAEGEGLRQAEGEGLRQAEGERESEAKEDEAALRAVLRASRSADRRAGRALRGPHRVDLRICRRSRRGDIGLEFCSSGEQKALLLGLVLAHARMLAASERQGAPILLLDEVAAHLDAVRRGALFEVLAQCGAQVWMSGVDAALFAECREGARFLSITGEGVAPIARGARPRLRVMS